MPHEGGLPGTEPTSIRGARAATDAAHIQISSLSIMYTRSDGTVVPAVADLSLEVQRGEFLTLIGPSGCGKTSLIRAIGGLVKPSAGEVRVESNPVQGPMPDKVAYVFQDFALFPWRSARANVEIALELQGVPRAVRRSQALEVLETVGLRDFADRHPAELSGGMKQRVAIARALAANSDVLLLDEPFGALDEQTRLVLGMELLRLLETLGKTIVFVTHSLQEAAYLSDRVVVLTARPGQIIKSITVPLERPRTPDMLASPECAALQAELFSLIYDASTMSIGTRC